jgi:single-strand DNA-binding protein
MDLNRAQLIGNVTRDPESRTTPSGQTVCNFAVATNSQWTDSQGQKQTKAEFHNIVAWGKLAEICGQYLVKGKKIYVEGRLQTRDWEAQDGSKRRTTEIVADNMIMLDRGGAPGTSQEPVVTPIDPHQTDSPKMEKGMGDQEIRLEDIPF